MTSSRVGNSVAVASLDLFAWDTRSQENDFTASVRDGAGTCVSGDSAQGRRLPTGISAGALGASHAGRGWPSPPWRATAPTAPSPLQPRDKSPNAPTRRTQKMRLGRRRAEPEGISGGVGGFELRAGWAKPQTKCARDPQVAWADVSAYSNNRPIALYASRASANDLGRQFSMKKAVLSGESTRMTREQ